MAKKIAHCIPHTHWDPFWYFTPQDSMVTFCYNMKEMIRAFEAQQIEYFFLDGQTVAIDEYLELHPEDIEKVKELVSSKNLVIGPFNSQLDCFISSGESIINNLRLGIRNADVLGGSSKIAYLADPFGHNYDFPKIFNQMGIYDFIITRGVGDEYGLGIDFYFKSNDGSQVLTHTMLAGYGYGAYAFKEGTLFSKDALDYNNIDVQLLIDRLLSKTVLKNEFVFPLGFDQNPIMLGIKEKIEAYNNKFKDYEFKLTTWEDYLNRVQLVGKDLKTHDGELMSAQYHRIHKSGMNSARADIKTIQDTAERILTFESQPMMAMLDAIGIPYDQAIIDKAWYTLVNTQTHASATHIDDTNANMKNYAKEALSIAIAAKVYLMRLMAVSIKSKDGDMPLVIFNTLPYKRDQILSLKIITKTEYFELIHHDEKLDYTIVESHKEYAGVVKKDVSQMNEDKYFYRTEILIKIPNFRGISYKTIFVKELSEPVTKNLVDRDTNTKIENDRYCIKVVSDGIHIIDKRLNKVFKRSIFIEDSGDEGDNYDYSYPDSGKDWILHHHFEDAVCNAYNSDLYSELNISGAFLIPKDLSEREEKKKTSILKYKLRLVIRANSSIIEMKANFNNQAENHRVRLVVSSELSNSHSYAGTQFGYIKRETNPKELQTWRDDNWFEEPSTTNPLLNHVSAVGDDYVVSVFTKSVKEYDFIGEDYSYIAMTIYRSCGHVGLPDLNRRPGRPSGLANKIFETPDSQMIGDIRFEIGIGYYNDYDGNTIMKEYTNYATSLIYYQQQNFDKTVFPISYFPINPWQSFIPEEYSFVELEETDACFGTMIKAIKKNGYILRIFNSEYHDVRSGQLTIGCVYEALNIVNLLEEAEIETSENQGILKKGELRNILIKTKLKDRM